MKLAILSDIHLEFGRFDLQPPKDVDAILLPGDICTPHQAANTKYGDEYQLHKRFKKFFAECNAVAKTYMVLGNHEHYHGCMERTIPKLQEVSGDTIILDGNSCTLGDYALWGGTLWTDLNKDDPLVEYHVKHSMNDFALTNLDLVRHRALNQYYTRNLEEFVSNNDKVIIMTHHAPHYASVPTMYQSDILSYAYANTKLDHLLEEHLIWIHGHIHTKHDYMLDNTRVICNPRGYPSERQLDFLIIEV